MQERRHSSQKRSADSHIAAIADGLIELFGNTFDPFRGRIERTDHRVGRSFGAVSCNKPSVMQRGDFFVQAMELLGGLDELVGEHQSGHDCQTRIANLSKLAPQIDDALIDVVRKRLQLFFLPILASETELSAGDGGIDLCH
jgi:hypothetical protein